jgi:hypothetical protein
VIIQYKLGKPGQVNKLVHAGFAVVHIHGR